MTPMNLDPQTVAAFQAEVDRQARRPAAPEAWPDAETVAAFERALAAAAAVDRYEAQRRALVAAALDFTRAEVRRQLAARRRSTAKAPAPRAPAPARRPTAGAPRPKAPAASAASAVGRRGFGLRFDDGRPLELECSVCGLAQAAVGPMDARGRRHLVCARCGRRPPPPPPPAGLRAPLTGRPLLTGLGR